MLVILKFCFIHSSSISSQSILLFFSIYVIFTYFTIICSSLLTREQHKPNTTATTFLFSDWPTFFVNNSQKTWLKSQKSSIKSR